MKTLLLNLLSSATSSDHERVRAAVSGVLSPQDQFVSATTSQSPDGRCIIPCSFLFLFCFVVIWLLCCAFSMFVLSP